MAIFGAGIASYMTIADGNVSDGSIWALIDSVSATDAAGASNNNSYPELTSGSLSTTAYQKSSTFTYSSGPTIDGIAIKLLTRGVTGTLTLALDQANVDVTGTTVVANVVDLPLNGWIFFKFAAPVVLGALTYSVKFKTSTASQVTLKTSSGISKLLRTTTTGTPPAATNTQKDNLYICGEVVSGVVGTRNVTWDISSAPFPFNMITIGGKAIVSVENNASTNYAMHSQNDVRIHSTGVLNIGTSSTPMQATSSFTFTHASVVSIRPVIMVMNGGTLNAYGQPKTTQKTKLTANLAIAATSMSVAAATDWAIGDKLGIASTTNDFTETEQVAITSVSGTTIGFSPALTYAHAGSGLRFAEVINLTRNILFTGTTSVQVGFMACFSGSIINLNYAEFQWYGGGITGFTGIYINTAATATINIYNCALHDWLSGCGFEIGTQAGTVNLVSNVTYKLALGHLYAPLNLTASGTVNIDNNVFMCTTSTGGIMGGSIVLWGLGFLGATFTNNTMVSTSGLSADANIAAVRFLAIGSPGVFIGNTIHGSKSHGLYIGSVQTTTLTLTWYSQDWAISDTYQGITFGTQLQAARVVMNGLAAFSNTNATLVFAESLMGDNDFFNLNIQGGSSPVGGCGIWFTGGSFSNRAVSSLDFDSCNIGDVTAHGGADLAVTSSVFMQAAFRNSKFSANPISGQSNLSLPSYIGSDRHQQTTGYIGWATAGTFSSDYVIYGAGAPSLRIKPIDAVQIVIANFFITVPTGQGPTVSIRVRKSNTTAGDSATYNGMPPEFWIWPNPIAGIADHTKVATATSASDGAWETLSAIIPPVLGDSIVQVYVKINGTTGWVNFDDFATSVFTSNTGNLSFSRGGQPFVVLGNGSNTLVPVPIIRKKVF